MIHRALLFFLVPVSPVWAQAADTLAPLVVTATRTPVPASALANGVTVIEGDLLRRAGIVTVAEALRAAPSIALAQAGSRGAQTSLFLRGGENDFVRVLVDGVPLNQAGGFIDLANLTTDHVERIEIVRGPVSVVYGSDAMTGVVQIITRRGAGAPRLSAEGRGGSNGSAVGRLELAGGSVRSGFSGSLLREVTDGLHALNNQYANTALGARATLAPDAATDIALTLRHRDGEFHYPTDGAGNIADSNQHQLSRQSVLSLDAGRRLAARVEVRALLGLVAGRDSVDDAPDSPGDSAGIYAYSSRIRTARRSADLRVNVQVAAPLLLTAGAALDRESERSVNAYQSSFGPGGGSTDTARTNRALYAQGVFTRGKVGVQAGARVDNNGRFGTFVTSRLGLSLQVAPRTRLRANTGTAFKEPTFGEHYSSGFSVGNPDLRPERSRSVEAGIEQLLAGGRAGIAVTGFGQRFRDLIQYTPALTGPNYFNVASARASGVEVETRIMAAARLELAASYTWLRTSAADSGYDGTVFAPGKRLLRRPTHLASLTAAWSAGSSGMGARVLYVGDRDDLDFSSFPFARVTLPAYGRLDVWGQVTVLRRRDARGAVMLTGRIENLAGARYQEIKGFAAPGRRLLAGIRVDARR